MTRGSAPGTARLAGDVEGQRCADGGEPVVERLQVCPARLGVFLGVMLHVAGSDLEPCPMLRTSQDGRCRRRKCPRRRSAPSGPGSGTQGGLLTAQKASAAKGPLRRPASAPGTPQRPEHTQPGGPRVRGTCRAGGAAPNRACRAATGAEQPVTAAGDQIGHVGGRVSAGIPSRAAGTRRAVAHSETAARPPRTPRARNRAQPQLEPCAGQVAHRCDVTGRECRAPSARSPSSGVTPTRSTN